MPEKNLLQWFGKRRESNVVSLTRAHAGKVLDTSVELDSAIVSAMEDRKADVGKSLGRLFAVEEEADILEVDIHEELAKGGLPPKEREDLMHMIRRMDRTADWIKDSGRNLDILMSAGIPVPKDIWSSLREMSKRLRMCVQSMKCAVDNIGIDDAKVGENQKEVERMEHEMDDIYICVKKKLVGSPFEARLIIIVRDILHAMENAADNCKDAADMIHILLVSRMGPPG